MPYLGQRCKIGDNLVTVKAFDEETEYYDATVSTVISNAISKLPEESTQTGIFELTNMVSSELRDPLLKGCNVLWYEVEVMTKAGTMYGLTRVRDDLDG